MAEKMKNHSKIYVYDVEDNKIDKKTKQNKHKENHHQQ